MNAAHMDKRRLESFFDMTHGDDISVVGAKVRWDICEGNAIERAFKLGRMHAQRARSYNPHSDPDLREAFFAGWNWQRKHCLLHHFQSETNMRNISFQLTTEAIRNRTKTVTRRLNWLNLKPGDLLQGCEKCMGRRHGEPLVKLAVIRPTTKQSYLDDLLISISGTR